jgi:mandelamide amidase
MTAFEREHEMAELTELCVGEAAAAIRRGEITSEALAEALIGRVRDRAKLNAFIAFEPDQVRESARAADRHRASGAALTVLHGVPLAIKDNLDAFGYATTGGTPGLSGNRPKRDAPVVEKLVASGAIVLGKTNMHELAYGITNNNAGFGAARNPHDPDRIPGGSSGGTGVAVAARMAPGGIGSDTGGSVRIPAALCGITGLRPTVGRWPQAGIVPISHTRDTAGPMTRSVADCALLDGIVTGGPTNVTPASLKGLRLGVPRGLFWEGLDPELGAILEDRLGDLIKAGAVLIEADIEDAGRLDREAGFPIAIYEFVGDLTRYLAEHESPIDLAGIAGKIASPDVKAIVDAAIGAGAIPEAAYRQAIERDRPALQEAYRRCFREHDLGAVIFPTTPLPASRIGEDETVMVGGKPVPTFATFIRNTSPGSVAGIPGLSLPAGMTKAGLPVGMEIDGLAGNDHQLLAIGAALEHILPKPPAPPLR